MIMDIELEKKIEQLEQQRDNAMRIRCPLVARKYQRKREQKQEYEQGKKHKAMTTDTANQIISKYESLVVLCTYNILLTNDICCGQVIECLHAMKRTPYYKQAFKRYLNDADKARKEYERTVNSVIGSDRSEFFADCNDKYTEEVNKHVDMLYWQFKQALDDNGISHSAEIARFEPCKDIV